MIDGLITRPPWREENESSCLPITKYHADHLNRSKGPPPPILEKRESLLGDQKMMEEEWKAKDQKNNPACSIYHAYTEKTI